MVKGIVIAIFVVIGLLVLTLGLLIVKIGDEGNGSSGSDDGTTGGKSSTDVGGGSVDAGSGLQDTGDASGTTDFGGTVTGGEVGSNSGGIDGGSDSGSGGGSDDSGTTVGSGTDGSGVPQLHTIIMDLSGFTPSTLNIIQGDIVTFEAVDDSGRWPASNIHPTHRSYPGSGIEKCGTPEEPGIFDACRALDNGESYPFIFDEIGTWEYHDHRTPGINGIIIVN